VVLNIGGGAVRWVSWSTTRRCIATATPCSSSSSPS